MIDATILEKIKAPVGNDDVQMEIMGECYEVIGEIEGNEEIVKFIELIINNNSAFEYVFTIFLGLRGCLDNGPMTLASLGIVPLIGDINDPSVKSSLVKLKEYGISLGVDAGISEKELLDMFFLR